MPQRQGFVAVHPRLLLAAALLATALAGCTQPPAPPPPPPDEPYRAAAPWWQVGDAYTVRVERAGQAPTTYRMVNFWNDTETQHFWLGVADRRQALDHALFDTNPFLGRVHHNILTPHEKGMHAAMYQFPLEDGKAWSGFFFGRNWAFRVGEARFATPLGQDRGFLVEGSATDGSGHRIAYTYSPKLRWFHDLEERDASGATLLQARVVAFERGATGTYHFLRGRDFYKGPSLGGTHDERFEVQEEVDALAFYVRARAQGPLEVQLLDPQGQVRERSTATGGEARLLEEVRPVAMGSWRVRYVATGAIEGTVLATGLIEYARTI